MVNPSYSFSATKKKNIQFVIESLSALGYNIIYAHIIYDRQLTLLIQSGDDLREHTLTAHLVCLCQSPCWKASFLVFEL